MKRGTRVRMKYGNPRHEGTIEAILHRRHGSFAAIRWDNGWHSTFGFGELEIASNRRHPTEYELLKSKLQPKEE